MRQALTEFLLKDEPQETAYSLLKKGGLIGIIKDAPADLSTSKKHFRGFGRNR